MNFIFKWLKKRIKDVDQLADCYEPTPDVSSRNSINSSGVTLTLYKADGGHVVETSWYDKNHDRHVALHIATEDQNLGERLSQIFTFESIKR